MIELVDVKKHFPVRKSLLDAMASLFTRGREERYVRAVNSISFSIERGEVFGLAGESGCGKTTTGMLLLGLYSCTDGKIIFEGRDLRELKGAELKDFRKRAQLIFQDPFESMNPRFTVRRTIDEPLRIHNLGSRKERFDRIVRAMERARLTPIESFIDKYPHELSGGERQRVCIARAIVMEPTLLVDAEAVSMLDVSIRASILNLLRDLTEELQMAMLYISHDVALLGSLCKKVAVMYAGEIIEMGKPRDVISEPLHPYTKALIAAVPVPDFSRVRHTSGIISGEPPDLTRVIRGCAFQTRCPARTELCSREKPRLRDTGSGHLVACPFAGKG
ncbi:MAG: ABC transporter ATP-binding protein [Deltaproteobacteria bacterium]|nr:ABC transporter ATP-binding protein [Deltaproteobacteria bacterium]